MKRPVLGLLLCSLVTGPAWAQEAPTVDPLTGAVTTPAEPAEEPAEAGPDLSAVNKKILAQDFAAADELLAAIEKEFPDDVSVTVMRGEVLLALGDAETALPYLTRAAEAEPERPRLQFQLGSALLSTGDTAGALAAFAAEAVNNEDPEVKALAHLNRALILQRERKWDDAAADLEAVLAIDPTRQEVYGDLASLYLRTGNVDDASRVLDAGFDAGFQSAAHYYSLGARIFRNKDYERAIAAFRRALELDPKHAKSERSLGAALDKLGRGDEAVVHFKRYLELDPTAADASKIREQIAGNSGS